ncbi:cupin domain-containing protein [Treponema sp.]
MFFLASEMTTKQIDATSQRTIKALGGTMMISEMTFEKGGVGAMHSHPHEQVMYVLEGEADFTIGDETRRVKAGDSAYLAPNLVHGVVAVTKFRALDVFTPQREDFLG